MRSRRRSFTISLALGTRNSHPSHQISTARCLLLCSARGKQLSTDDGTSVAFSWLCFTPPFPPGTAALGLSGGPCRRPAQLITTRKTPNESYPPSLNSLRQPQVTCKRTPAADWEPYMPTPRPMSKSSRYVGCIASDSERMRGWPSDSSLRKSWSHTPARRRAAILDTLSYSSQAG